MGNKAAIHGQDRCIDDNIRSILLPPCTVGSGIGDNDTAAGDQAQHIVCSAVLGMNDFTACIGINVDNVIDKPDIPPDPVNLIFVIMAPVFSKIIRYNSILSIDNTPYKHLTALNVKYLRGRAFGKKCASHINVFTIVDQVWTGKNITIGACKTPSVPVFKIKMLNPARFAIIRSIVQMVMKILEFIPFHIFS